VLTKLQVKIFTKIKMFFVKIIMKKKNFFLTFFVIKSKKEIRINKSEVWDELKKIVFKSEKKYSKKIFFFIIPA